ncbi:MAG: helix-turn-helix transcriptional regulator [Clostridia bacterium]|nr:helix-turn-helix transcriptional regulator [Clostridia bacterium]
MNIGSTIKKLRRAKDMTQEDLAEYLNVSVSAVSQWEAGKTAPDLSLIPPLCSLLNVTSDELLGIDLEAKQKRIDEITDEAHSYSSRGYGKRAHEILSAGLREFPDSFEIMFFLMYDSFNSSRDNSYSKEERERFRDEAVRIAELILEKCTDDGKRHSAIQILCFIYPEIGKRERAAELAGKMPTMVISKEFLATRIYSGSEGYESDKYLLDNLIQHLSNQIVASGRKRDNGEFYYTDDDRAVLRDKRIAFLELMYEDGDMGFYHCHLARTHENQARYYAKGANAAKTLAHLEKAAEHAIGFVKYAAAINNTHTYTCTSLLFRDHTHNTSFTTGSSENDAMELLRDMEASIYDFVRDKPEFVAVTDRLKVYADKWEPAGKLKQ